ncbi:MAG: TonB-dependent receptor [Flavobacteriaceae bacterium]|jgi:TonB-dependent starch-binding outer membrane protein SusC|nr:TonB-dependent receptor [Flavobacteriaceae bacterium]
MKTIFRLIIFSVLTPLVAFAQSKTITGTINDELGLPLPGVTIQVKDSNNLGAVTNFDGVFKISIPSDAKQSIILSYIGYLTEEVDVSKNKIVSVNLQVDTDQLDEVVVVGYGTVLKKDITGSLSSVTVKEEVANQSTSVDQLLQGRAAGVQVIQNGGAPGSGISVKIRGTNSLRGNNEPLYVIDGVIISSAGEDVSSAGGGLEGQEVQNGLNGINPRDIESIQVLKDASATAIYGSRGANGVVLITTKKGTNGKTKVNTFLTTSIRTITKKYNVLDGFGFANYVNEINENNGVDQRYLIEGSTIYTLENGTPLSDPAQEFNWQDEIYTDGISQKFGASASGGSDQGNYYISAGFDSQEGIVKKSSFKSGDVRINLDQKLNDNLKIKARLSGFFSSSDFAEGGDLAGGSNRSLVRNAIAFRPLLAFNDDGIDVSGDETLTSPYAWIDDFSDISKATRYIGSLGLTYKLPIKGMSYEVTYGGNVRNKDRRRWFGPTTFQGRPNGALQMSTLNTKSHQFNNLLKFNRKFNRKHRINSLVGVIYDVRNVERSIYAVAGFITTQFTTSQPAFGESITRPLTLAKSDQQIVSLLGRLNYTYDNKYTLTATIRRDGVSKFSEGNKYGVFPSFALAWNVGNENFVKNSDLFESLKLRAGWGQIGNHGINPYGTLSNYGVSDNLYGNAEGGTNIPIGLLNLSNPDLTWETTEQLNFGLDFSTLNDVVSGTIDIYDKTTKDLLQNSNIPASSGFSNILVNKGAISNKGVEVALNFVPISTDVMELSFGGNISFNKTQITDLNSQPLQGFYENGAVTDRRFYYGNRVSGGNHFKSPANVFVEGKESSLFYGFQTDGIYQTEDTDFVSLLGVDAVPGDVRIIDQLTEDTDGDGVLDSGDGVIDVKDRTFIGNPNPDFIYGFNMNLRFKRFTVSALFNGVYGNEIANGNLLQLENAEASVFNNISPEAYNNAWRPDNQSNTHPRIGYTTVGQAAITDRIIEDGSYLRLNNLTIGYDIPVTETSLFDRLNVYIAGQNLFTWTNYTGYDPEVSTFLYTGLINGVDFNGAPNARNLLLGVNMSF